jgi:hypothetical protein
MKQDLAIYIAVVQRDYVGLSVHGHSQIPDHFPAQDLLHLFARLDEILRFHPLPPGKQIPKDVLDF